MLLRARAETLGSLADTTVLNRTNVNDVGVNSAGNTVLRLDVQLGDFVALDSGVILNITLGGGVNQVTNKEPRGGFVLQSKSVKHD